MSLCRYAEPELIPHSLACTLLRAPLPHSASAKIKPLVDLVRGSLVNHRNRLLEHGMCTVTTPDPVSKPAGQLVAPGAPMKEDSAVTQNTEEVVVEAAACRRHLAHLDNERGGAFLISR